MKSKSAQTINWLAGILVVTGWAVISPSGAFASFLLATICAAFPMAFASKRPRIIGALLLIISLASAISLYPQFERDREAYAGHAKQRAHQAPLPPATSGEVKK